MHRDVQLNRDDGAPGGAAAPATDDRGGIAGTLPLERGTEVVTVELAGAWYGILVERVTEVLRPLPLTALPHAPVALLGVASVRGTVLPVIDLGQRLTGRAADTAGRWVVVTSAAREAVGVRVDAVGGIVAAPGPMATVIPPAVEASLPAGMIAGVITPAAGAPIAVLDLERVLALRKTLNEEAG